MSELQSIFADGRKIKIGEKEITIKGIELGQIPTLIDIVSKFMSILPQGKQPSTKVMIAVAIGKEFNSVINLFKITTDLDEDTIKRLNLAASTLILENVIKDNADFFIANVVPLVQGLTENLSKTINGLNKSKS